MFGPMSVASSRGSPCRGAGQEAGQELLRHRLVDQQPGAGQADLAGVVVLADRVPDRQVQVGVSEHQQRGLAAELERGRSQLRAGRCGDLPAGLDRAGEAHPGQVWMRGQRRAGLAAQPLHDVEHAVRQPRVPGDVGQQAGGKRRPLGRLGHHRVPGRQRGRDPPGREHERGVPRRDDRGYPGRRPGHLLAVAADLQVPAVQPDEPVGEEAEVLRRPRHHAAQVRAEQRAVVQRLDLREIGPAGGDPVGDGAQDPGPRRRRRGGPAREGPPGGLDGRIHLGLAAAGHLGQGLLVKGGQVGERGAGRKRAGHAHAADPVPGVDRHPGHVRPAHPDASTFPPSQVTPTCW
jgi:hypothetical protein